MATAQQALQQAGWRVSACQEERGGAEHKDRSLQSTSPVASAPNACGSGTPLFSAVAKRTKPNRAIPAMIPGGFRNKLRASQQGEGGGMPRADFDPF